MCYKNLTFYCIRHGETEWNKLDLFQGSSDSPLTLLGINQGKQTAKALKNIEFKACYSSYQKRAIDTAKNIIDARSIPLFFHEGLLEIDFGLWEGKHVPDFYNDSNFYHLKHNPAQYSTIDNKGEDFIHMADRSVTAIRDIITCHQQGNILVVSHGTLLRQLIHVLTGGDWQTHLQHVEKLNNVSISILNYQQKTENTEGEFKIQIINDISHL